MRQRFASSFLPGHPGSAQWTLVPLRFYLVTQEVPGGRWCLFVSTWSPRKRPVDAGASSFLPGPPGSARWTLVPLRFYLVPQEVPSGRWCLFISTWSPRKCPVDAGVHVYKLYGASDGRREGKRKQAPCTFKQRQHFLPTHSFSYCEFYG